jgi:hypothetical protein
MPTRYLATLAAIVLAAGCADAPETPEEQVMSPLQVLPNIAVPPGGSVVSTEGGADAASVLLSTPLAVDSVLMFYRDVLSKPPYRLVNEALTGKMTSFYVEQEGPPLWVTVEGLDAGGTFIRLSGAAVKTTGTVPPANTTGDSSS